MQRFHIPNAYGTILPQYGAIATYGCHIANIDCQIAAIGRSIAANLRNYAGVFEFISKGAFIFLPNPKVLRTFVDILVMYQIS
jgi:hypothetical protein